MTYVLTKHFWKVWLALWATALAAQSTHPITGRQIAPVMGVRGADWLDRTERQSEEDPERAIRELHLKPGMTVADIGAGTGYYTIRIAKLLSPTGKVLANDIQPEMLARLRAKAKAAGVNNVETILGAENDARLPRASIDMAIMVDVYHELSQPQQMLDSIRTALKSAGELVLLEFRKEDANVPIRPEHKMALDQIKAEVEPQGYKFEKSVESLPWQHIVFFTLAAAN
jgi:ubiquinone/menaquinone biosynthesis C-methylase UbiE